RHAHRVGQPGGSGGASARCGGVRRAAGGTKPAPRPRATPRLTGGHPSVGGPPAGERRHVVRLRVRRRSDRGGARGRSATHQGGEVIPLTLMVFASHLVLAQDPSIVAPGAKLEKLFGDGFFTEGPAQAPDGSVYFSDITFVKASGNQAGHIWRWDPRTGTSTVFRSPSGMSNGIEFDQEGRMVVAEGAGFGGRRITRTDMKTGKSWILAGLYNGRPFNSPNDLVLDVRGGGFFAGRRAGWDQRGPGRQHLLRHSGSRATGDSCLLSGRKGAGLYPDAGDPDECEVWPGGGSADVVHYGGEESVSDSRRA